MADLADSVSVDTSSLPAELVRQLQRQIDAVETARRRGVERGTSVGAGSLDRLLPGGRLARGSLVEWISSGGGDGSDILSWLTARQATVGGGAMVVVDLQGRFRPPGTPAWRVEPESLIVLRPPGRAVGVSDSSRAEAALDTESSLAAEGRLAARQIVVSPSRRLTLQDWMWAVDQSLRCPAVAAVWARLSEIDERWFRRFQLSAEASGCVGVFVRPLAARHQPSWSDVRWEVQPLATDPELLHRRRLRVRLVRCRGGRAGRSTVLAIDAVDGSIHDVRETIGEKRHVSFDGSSGAAGAEFVAVQLAHPAPSRRAKRA